ncbi:MAG: hypothetical protein DIU71_04460 [Proteobacteria bacterium]|nr:MAG: hypothetical protein DIU71_04460 [Pseudomonadota bacterium]
MQLGAEPRAAAPPYTFAASPLRTAQGGGTTLRNRCLLGVAALLVCGVCVPDSRESEQHTADPASAQRATGSATERAAPLPVTDEALDAELAALPRLTAFVLAQHGRVLREHYGAGRTFERPVNIKSASKGVLNALTGIALQRGDLRSLDARIDEYLTEPFAEFAADDPRRAITVRHLLTMSSGLRSTSIHHYGAWVSSADWIRYALRQEMVHAPGERMVYSTGDTHLLAAVLTEATGMSLRTFAQRHLFDELGVEIGGWDRDPQGYHFGGNNMALSPRALLALGRLYLDDGRHAGRQMLPPGWVEQSWTPRFLNSSYNLRHDYGWLWWHTRLTGYSTWFAWGYGGQFLFVLPALDAVVVMLGDPDARTRGDNNRVYSVMERTIVPYLQARHRSIAGPDT